MGAMGAGGGRCLTTGAAAAVTGGWDDPAGRSGRVGAVSASFGVPPFLGLWWVYQKFSTSFTSHRPWWSLTHSTERTPKGVLPGTASAAPYDHATGERTTTATATASQARRPRNPAPTTGPRPAAAGLTGVVVGGRHAARRRAECWGTHAEVVGAVRCSTVSTVSTG